MSEQDYLNEAIKEREIASKELLRMAQHLMKCDEVLAKAKRRLALKEFQVSMSLEDVGEREQEPSCVTQM